MSPTTSDPVILRTPTGRTIAAHDPRDLARVRGWLAWLRAEERERGQARLLRGTIHRRGRPRKARA